jgi:hypothetical protein
VYIMFNDVSTGFLIIAIGIDLFVSLLTIINCFRITKRIGDIIVSIKNKFIRNKE